MRTLVSPVTLLIMFLALPSTGHAQRPPSDILLLNAWIRKYAEQTGSVYVDYYSALADENGFLKEGLSTDGLHPNDKGYALMAPLVQSALEKSTRQ